MRTSFLRTLGYIVAAILLASCAATPPQPEPELIPSELSLDQLYQQIPLADSPLKERLILTASQRLLAQGDLSAAAQLLEPLNPETLPSDLRAEVILTQAELLQSQNQPNEALQLLESLNQAQLNEDLLWKFLTLKEDLFERLNRPLDASIVLNQLINRADETDQPNLIETMWLQLTLIPQDDLIEQTTLTTDSTFLAWLELALLNYEYQLDLDGQLRALSRWQQAHPQHPASRYLPGELALLNNMVAEQPEKITLLLPLNGANAAAGKAIRDGFLAAYFSSLTTGSRLPQIEIIDTSGPLTVMELYSQAVNQGADLIIGPLDKDKVQQLEQLSVMPVPTLALNYSSSSLIIPGFYQFGLAAEDEARQVAEFAILQGYRTSVTLTPDSDWGNRVKQAFAEQWQQQGGTLLDSAAYSSGYSYLEAIHNLMNLDKSEAREKRVEAVTGLTTQFNARRRQDIDFIFIAGTPVQARQIKPTLAFQFAGDLPVLATSAIFSGENAPQLDRDLNEIYFTETPWMLSRGDNDIKMAVSSAIADSASLGRLYALGSDAYLLYPRLKQLSALQQSRLQGNTGVLRMENQRIHRTLQWAEFVDGNVRQLP